MLKNLSVFGLMLCTFIPKKVFASVSTGLPWESPLQTFQASLSGPVAMSISIIAIVVSGATLIFGGEISEFARRMIIVVMVIALLVSANTILAMLFGVGGAVI
ncbi:MAG: TrbC/VirB2 family protein [Candidatus Margulisbacteria bacterium]|nr:TrbC/VirB2 family protein [Candidatus Margulisiibacteriota bacterium]